MRAAIANPASQILLSKTNSFQETAKQGTGQHDFSKSHKNAFYGVKLSFTHTHTGWQITLQGFPNAANSVITSDISSLSPPKKGQNNSFALDTDQLANKISGTIILPWEDSAAAPLSPEINT